MHFINRKSKKCMNGKKSCRNGMKLCVNGNLSYRKCNLQKPFFTPLHPPFFVDFISRFGTFRSHPFGNAPKSKHSIIIRTIFA